MSEATLGQRQPTKLLADHRCWSELKWGQPSLALIAEPPRGVKNDEPDRGLLFKWVVSKFWHQDNFVVDNYSIKEGEMVQVVMRAMESNR